MDKVIKRYFPIFVLPMLPAFTMEFIAPLLMGVYLSFCKFTTIDDATFVGFSNYTKIFTDGALVHSLWYTAPFTIVSVILTNFSTFLTAMLLTREIKGTNIFRAVFFIPNLIGGVILGYIWGLLSGGILLQTNKALIYSSTYGFWGLIILMCWQRIDYMMIIYIAGIQNIPGNLVEAAKIGGTNNWDILKNMIIPMVIPPITIYIFLTLINGFKLFGRNLALANKEPSNMSELLALGIFRTFHGRARWEDVGQVKAVVLFILVAVIAVGQNILTRSREVQQ